MRFVKRVGKLATFGILLQNGHEGGSAALVSGQSWSWTHSYQGMALLTPSFLSQFRPLEWNDSQYGYFGKGEKQLCQVGEWGEVTQMLTVQCPTKDSLTQTIPWLWVVWYHRTNLFEASSLNWEEGHLSQSYVIFYTLHGLTFPSIYSIVPICMSILS